MMKISQLFAELATIISKAQQYKLGLTMVGILFRAWPLLLALGLLALVIYAISSYRHNPTRAKEILVRTFTWICSILSGVMFLIVIYAALDENDLVLELGIALLVVTLALLGITQICKYFFYKNHPTYKKPLSGRWKHARKLQPALGHSTL